jgi:signal transduction histidine kinase
MVHLTAKLVRWAAQNSVITIAFLGVWLLTVGSLTAQAVQYQSLVFYADAPGLSADSLFALPTTAGQQYYNPERKSVWAKFSLYNASAQPQEVMLLPGELPKITLYQNNQAPQRTGTYLPIAQRSFPHHKVLFSVRLEPQQRTTLLVHLQTLGRQDLPLSWQPVLKTPAQQQHDDDWRLLIQGLFFGVILVMAFYNLTLYVAVRDVSYLYYVLCILGVGLYFFFYYGFSLQTIWRNQPVWNVYSFSVIVPLTGLARIVFTQAYLHTKQQLPWLHRFLNGLAVLCVVPMLMGLLAYGWGLPWYEATIDATGIMGTLILMSMLLAGTLTYLRGYTPALFFLLANILFVVGANMFIVKEMHLVADSLFTRYAVQLGVSAQVVLFSLGLAYRLKKARQEAAAQSLARERLEREKERERKQLVEEQKLQLENKVNERTAALQERTAELQVTISKLQESEEGLRQLNQIKDKLYSIISHDLRGPVATLDSFINIITKHAAQISEEEWEKLSGKTRESVHNLSFLLDNLLNWSRAQMGNLPFRPEAVGLAELAQKNIELYSLAAERKQLNILCAISPKVAVEADRSMLDFIIRNLLSNAIKYTPAYGSIKLLARTQNGQVRFMLTDTGLGLSPDQIRQLQQPGSHTSRPGTAREKGTGLGLMLCQEFLAKHQTLLQISSQVGQGSSFGFVLPKSETPAYAPSALEAETSWQDEGPF